MRKFFYLIPIAMLFACTEGLLDEVPAETPTSKQATVKTRAAEFQDFNPIDELADIPVNILNKGNTKYKYLSVYKREKKANLFNEDNNSGRQQWYIKKVGSTWPNSSVYALCVVGGNKYSDPNKDLFVTFDLIKIDVEATVMLDQVTSGNLGTGVIQQIPGTNFYYIFQRLPSKEDIMLTMAPYYLSSKKTSDDVLSYKYNNRSSDLAKWEIRPVGEYIIEDISYFKTETDLFNREDQRMDKGNIVLHNDFESTVTIDHTFQTSFTERSNFSKTEGITVSVSTGISVGLPIPDTKDNIQQTFTTSTQKSWTFGEEESNTQTSEFRLSVPVPPHTSVKVEIFKVAYQGTLTYVAKLKNPETGKTFRVKGKWTGVSTTDIYYNIKSADSGEIITRGVLNKQ